MFLPPTCNVTISLVTLVVKIFEPRLLAILFATSISKLAMLAEAGKFLASSFARLRLDRNAIAVIR
ncbi:hypothetical protein A1E_03120 [Rickettsia canadensis str. McKiel]|uniref:Uncharacterized protein n=1 Tax=Rickettsia canadensis (strain McKiel) TaxID=293613 RepID=A8EYX6_RICCK|nr:hypothetical protein A1E_03120 [Rickettsia canadensis str. McKiel]